MRFAYEGMVLAFKRVEVQFNTSYDYKYFLLTRYCPFCVLHIHNTSRCFKQPLSLLYLCLLG